MKFLLNQKNKLLLCLFLFVFQASFAADLHCIYLLGNVNRIESSCEKDLKEFHKMLKSVAYYSGLKMKERVFRDKERVQEDILKWIRDLPSSQDDLFVFYYSGHGYRMASTDKIWPLFHLKEAPQKSFGLNDLVIAISQKKCRFSMVLSDTCNSYIDGRDGHNSSRASKRAENLFKLSPEACKKLFLNSSGMIIATSSIPVQTSSCTSDLSYTWGGPYIGGLFTSGLIQSIKIALRSPKDPSWENIFEHTNEHVRSMSHWMGCEQNSVYQWIYE